MSGPGHQRTPIPAAAKPTRPGPLQPALARERPRPVREGPGRTRQLEPTVGPPGGRTRIKPAWVVSRPTPPLTHGVGIRRKDRPGPRVQVGTGPKITPTAVRVTPIPTLTYPCRPRTTSTATPRTPYPHGAVNVPNRTSVPTTPRRDDP